MMPVLARGSTEDLARSPRRLKRAGLALCMTLFGLPAALGPGVPSFAADLQGDAALLQGLDKVTARISSLEAPLGEPQQFGTLEILVHRCLKRPPEEPPESAAFLDIHERRPGDAPVLLFSGWMFASSPALNALEHPVYDVWLKDCLNASASGGNGPS